MDHNNNDFKFEVSPLQPLTICSSSLSRMLSHFSPKSVQTTSLPSLGYLRLVTFSRLPSCSEGPLMCIPLCVFKALLGWLKKATANSVKYEWLICLVADLNQERERWRKRTTSEKQLKKRTRKDRRTIGDTRKIARTRESRIDARIMKNVKLEMKWVA